MKELDEDTRLKLIGLKALAEDHCNKLEDIERVALQLLGMTKDDDRHGNVSDFVYDNSTDLATVLDRLGWLAEGEALKAGS